MLEEYPLETKYKSGVVQNAHKQQRIIVIGASTGGFEAFKKIIKDLPGNFSASIFIVWHMSPDVRGILPEVLNRESKIFAANAYNNEEIKPNRIYVAPPDHHLIIKESRVIISHGPRENRFRPAVDPLFRSAAFHYRNRVIGIILSGGLDDGTAGLWAVKHHGGIAVVQNPLDAEVSSMPESALQKVNVDYVVPVNEMAELLVRLINEPVAENNIVMHDEQTKKEIDIATEESGMQNGVLKFDELTPYSCPECHGVLSRLHNDNIVRYRCHTGHAYSANALLTSITEKIEEGLYSALRGMEESVMLLNHLGDHFAEANEPKLAATYFRKANEADARSAIVRKIAINHEQLSESKLEAEANENA